MIIIAACPLAGKTTAANRFESIREVDEARTLISDEQEAALKKLRHADRWEEHNSIWHNIIKAWAASLPDNSTILVHSIADGEAIGGKVDMVVDLPMIEYLERATALSIDGDEHDERIMLGMMCKRQNVQEAKRRGIPIFPSIEAATGMY